MEKEIKPHLHPFQANNVHHVQAFHLSAILSVSKDRLIIIGDTTLLDVSACLLNGKVGKK